MGAGQDTSRGLPRAKAETKSSSRQNTREEGVPVVARQDFRRCHPWIQAEDILVPPDIERSIVGVTQEILKLDLGEVKRKLVGWNQFASAVPSRLIAGNQDVTQLYLVVLLLLFPGFAYR